MSDPKISESSESNLRESRYSFFLCYLRSKSFM